MNLDTLKLFPNQEIDGDPTECTALTAVDIAGNIDGQTYDPDFTYAMTLRLLGVQPTDAGTDPLAALKSIVWFGAMPTSLETFTAKTMGELYAANWNNYSLQDQQAAFQHLKNGTMTLDTTIDAIVAYMNEYKMGVSLAMRWYESFMSPLAGGVLPAPAGNFTYHNVGVWDGSSTDITLKPNLGPTFGDNGYVHMTQGVFLQSALGAYAFNPNAIRWITVLGDLAVRFPALLSYLPKLL